MDFVWVVLGVAVVAVALYFTATLLFGPGEPPGPAAEELATPLPDGRDLTADDLRAAVLPVTARGYRMSDVDALIERVAQQLGRDGSRVALEQTGGEPVSGEPEAATTQPEPGSADEARRETGTGRAPRRQA